MLRSQDQINDQTKGEYSLIQVANYPHTNLLPNAESVESSLPLPKSDPFSTSSPIRLVPIYPSMVITMGDNGGDSRRIRRCSVVATAFPAPDLD